MALPETIYLAGFVVTFRTACFLGFFACVGLIAYALYAQHGLGLEPCPLCIFQRVAVMATGVVFLVAALHAPATTTGRRVYGGLAVAAATAGAAVAGRHVWLQSLPPEQVPACGPGLNYMMDTFPLMQALRMVFSGSGECAEVDWTLLGLSMPAWTLIAFIGLAAWAAGADGYLGFHFNCAELDVPPPSLCYGYVRLQTTAGNGFPATVVDYAYNRVGNPITIP